MTTTDTAYDRAIEYARETGAENGRAAASWCFDGNTTRETYAAVLKGIEAGDPEVLDTLPAADLSGEWADTLNGPALYRDACESAGLVESDGAYQSFDEICDAYESAFSTAVMDELTRAARYQLEG